jgi:hypothetical protein
MLPELLLPVASLLTCEVVTALALPAWNVPWLLLPFFCEITAVLSLPIWTLAELFGVAPAAAPFCVLNTELYWPVWDVAWLLLPCFCERAREHERQSGHHFHGNVFFRFSKAGPAGIAALGAR